MRRRDFLFVYGGVAAGWSSYDVKAQQSVKLALAQANICSVFLIANSLTSPWIFSP